MKALLQDYEENRYCIFQVGTLHFILLLQFDQSPRGSRLELIAQLLAIDVDAFMVDGTVSFLRDVKLSYGIFVTVIIALFTFTLSLGAFYGALKITLAACKSLGSHYPQLWPSALWVFLSFCLLYFVLFSSAFILLFALHETNADVKIFVRHIFVWFFEYIVIGITLSVVYKRAQATFIHASSCEIWSLMIELEDDYFISEGFYSTLLDFISFLLLIAFHDYLRAAYEKLF
ncbi:unnamed protein product [Caenorhabditis auriculariae]|uniref:Uncharacterized protein n=1 Tax=Caenorhabditis auriculariae TaxID=2777116 RepID=A0A8S1HC91_9PELO|nr:unnamed protein product [Caenorhabditis auriculariae]